jgi:hypothetical protein
MFTEDKKNVLFQSLTDLSAFLSSAEAVDHISGLCQDASKARPILANLGQSMLKDSKETRRGIIFANGEEGVPVGYSSDNYFFIVDKMIKSLDRAIQIVDKCQHFFYGSMGGDGNYPRKDLVEYKYLTLAFNASGHAIYPAFYWPAEENVTPADLRNIATLIGSSRDQLPI